MIKYRLECKNCLNNFDSWFASSKEFDKLKKLKLLNCNECGSTKIIKSLMSPNLNNAKKINNDELLKFQKIKKKIKNYQKFIEKNFEYVGKNFSYEARSLHYSDKKGKKGIYGKAKLQEIKELNEEGIKTQVVPWIKDKDN